MGEASTEVVVVNVDNFERVETNRMFLALQAPIGGANRWLHYRMPPSADHQPVIRPNRDTLYSNNTVDISEGATLTMPETGGRYMTAMVINQDHYIERVYDTPGTYELTMAEFSTPHVLVGLRTLVDPSDPADIAAANALQDQVVIESVSSKPFSPLPYDEESYQVTFDALIELGRGVGRLSKTFGKKEDVNPIRHLIGTAIAWGGSPEGQAYYSSVAEVALGCLRGIGVIWQGRTTKAQSGLRRGGGRRQGRRGPERHGDHFCDRPLRQRRCRSAGR